MPVNMQGAWTISVKSYEAFEPQQRFVVAGSSNGKDGNYIVNATTPAVYVTGDHWVITIQRKQGAKFVTAPDEITFPTLSSGNYQFDIRSNLPVTESDWDDVILTCATPVTYDDYLIYGSVSYYTDGCVFNPCFPRYMVVETPGALAAALKNPQLRVPIERLYPHLPIEAVFPPRPGPIPDPPPFQPLVIPLDGSASLPAKIAQAFKLAAPEATPTARKKKADVAKMDLIPLGSFTASKPAATVLDIDRVEIAGILGHLFKTCQTGSLPGVVLRFQEYDRSAAELAGGPYTGTGNRENLGVCATDRNGNYIFRFTRTPAQYLAEVAADVAPGETDLVQMAPDVIAQMLDAGRPSGYCYESAPYWNIPYFKRINICIPKDDIGRLPTACQGANAIQAIGNIFIGAPQSDGSRVGYSNTLGVEGRITARSSLADTPPARCAAWAGTLDLFACFLDHPEVTQYTLRYRALGETAWNFFQEVYRHPEIALIAVPGYSGTYLGPFARPLTIDGVPNTPAKAYDNIESNAAFVFTHRDRKAWISSWLYPPVHTTLYGARQYGPVQFRIEGYDGSGAKVAAADDIITLYIDNNGPDYDISSVQMSGQPGGDCALFNLNGNANTPLTVKFRANQLEGFLSSYTLGVRKGNIGSFGIEGTTLAMTALLTGAYVHGDDLVCTLYEGTFDTGSADASGYVTVDIHALSGHWLEVNQPFCTFAVQLSCNSRWTNGYNSAVYGYGPTEYLLGIQAS
jgi:hypothetical protein